MTTDRLPTVLEEQLTEVRIEMERAKLSRELTLGELANLELARERDVERDRQAKPGLTRRLNFFGDISPNNVDQVIGALEHWEARDPGEPVVITFNTPGGSVTDGLALYDTILRLRRKGHFITTRATGVAASMGAVLLQAGDERVMDARAKMLIHEGSTTFGKNVKMTVAEQEDYQTFSKMLRDDILEILAERSTYTRKQIENKWDRRDWWLTATEAVKYGFADRVE